MAVSGSIAAVAIGGGALYQGHQANKSAKTSARAYANAADQLSAFKSEGIGYLAPYEEAGRNALSPLTGLLTGQQYDPATGESNSLSPEQRDNLMYQSPGYRFTLEQTQNALAKSQAARGNLLSGGAQKELAQYSSGLASQYSNDYINQLSQLAGLGQNAATGMANTAIGAGTQISNLAANSTLSQASGQAQMGNIIGGSLSQLGGLAGFAGAQGAFGGRGGNTGGGGTGTGNYQNYQITAPSTAGYQFGGRNNY